MLSELGRVPSGPRLGHTGTAGAADRVFNFHEPYTRTTSPQAQPLHTAQWRTACNPRYCLSSSSEWRSKTFLWRSRCVLGVFSFALIVIGSIIYIRTCSVATEVTPGHTLYNTTGQGGRGATKLGTQHTRECRACPRFADAHRQLTTGNRCTSTALDSTAQEAPLPLHEARLACASPLPSAHSIRARRQPI